jgi:hypothetical protein
MDGRRTRRVFQPRRNLFQERRSLIFQISQSTPLCDAMLFKPLIEVASRIQHDLTGQFVVWQGAVTTPKAKCARSLMQVVSGTGFIENVSSGLGSRTIAIENLFGRCSGHVCRCGNCN